MAKCTDYYLKEEQATTTSTRDIDLEITTL